MQVLVAPDKFKGSLSAPEVAKHVKAGLLAADPTLDVRLMPVADGGEGTVDAGVAAGFTRVTARVSGPTGQELDADFAIRGKVAVIEMAAASGLGVLPGGVHEPLKATTFGTGQLVKAALDHGCTELVIGVGGSATTDGGSGMLRALGAVMTDAVGKVLPMGGGALSKIAHIDLTGLDTRLAGTRVTLASDVDNPLLGPNGAAAIFGPQKGATAAHVDHLEDSMERYFRILANELGAEAVDVLDAPGSGAAGGTGYAALAVLQAQRRPGIEVVLELAGFPDGLSTADLVITGEGSLDGQSLGGKAPVGVSRAAALAGVPVVVICGRNALSAQEVSDAGFAAAYALSDIEPDVGRSMSNAASLLEEVGTQIGQNVPLRERVKEESHG